MSSERFYIEDKDGDFVEAKDGILRVGGDCQKEDDICLPWDSVVIEDPDGDGVVFFSVEGEDSHGVYLDAAQYAALLDTLGRTAKAAKPPSEDYHAAKHDQGKPDPISDLRLLMAPRFFVKIQLAARALDAGFRFGQSERARWETLLDTIEHPHRSTGIGEAMHYGFQKYKKWGGWRDVPDALPRYQAAALRHFLFEKYYPEDAESGIDSESGIPHMSLAACNMAFVLELLK